MHDLTTIKGVDSMIHIFKRGPSEITLCLLHSEGHDENELMHVAKVIDPHANILAIRGNVIENGVYRFCKRKTMGVYDEKSLIEETHRLKSFINESARSFGFDINKVVVIGNGCGANIAINMLLHYDKAFHKAILFHPMIPKRITNLPNLNQCKIFIGAGENDYLTPQHEVIELTQILQSANAIVDVYFTKYGHQLSKDEIEAARIWCKEKVIYDV